MKQKILSVLLSPGLKQTAVVTGGNYIATLVSAVAMIIFSRVLGPESFGVFSAAFSLTLLVARIMDFGLGIAMQRQLAQEQGNTSLLKTHNLIQAVGLVRLISGVSIAVVGWFMSPYLAKVVFHIEDVNIIRLSLLSIGITIGFDFILTVIQSLHRFNVSSLLTIAQAGIKLIGTLAIIRFWVPTSLNALVLYVSAPSVGILYGLAAFRKQFFTPVAKTAADLKTILPVAKWSSIAILAAAVAEHFDLLITKATLSDFETGLYAGASRIAMFASLIGMSLGTVLSIRVAKYHQLEHLNKYIKKAILLAVGVTLLTLLAIPFGKLGILYTVGPEYLEAFSPLVLLLIATALTSAISPFVALFFVFNKTQYYSWSGLITMLVLVVSDLILIPRFGLMGAGAAKIITRVAVLVFTAVYTVHAYNDHVKTLRQAQS